MQQAKLQGAKKRPEGLSKSVKHVSDFEGPPGRFFQCTGKFPAKPQVAKKGSESPSKSDTCFTDFEGLSEPFFHCV